MSLLAALEGKNGGRPPLWLMRQAGRYLPEYQKLRAKHSFLELCHTPELVVAATLTPFTRFSLDAAILFSDILILLEALGSSVEFVEGEGPQVTSMPLYQTLCREKLQGPLTAIRLLKKELKVPLFGFAGAPFTLACYWIEGRVSRDIHQVKRQIYADPVAFQQLMELFTLAVVEWLQLQIQEGVEAVQLFDSWAHLLTLEQFQQFCLPYWKRIQEAVTVPLLVFSRNSHIIAPLAAAAGVQALSIDWTIPLEKMRQQYPHVVLQGNIDPDWLFAPLPVLQKAIDAMLEPMAKDPAYICNLGHGILPATPLAAVELLIERVHAC